MASNSAFRGHRFCRQLDSAHGAAVHRSDYRKLPDEEKVLDALRAAGVTPGPTYHFPHTIHKDMKSAEVAEKFKRGPVGLINVIPSGPPAMGKYLGLWFVLLRRDEYLRRLS